MDILNIIAGGIVGGIVLGAINMGLKFAWIKLFPKKALPTMAKELNKWIENEKKKRPHLMKQIEDDLVCSFGMAIIELKK